MPGPVSVCNPSKGTLNFFTGYPDAPAKIDISTFRKIPWENDVPFFLGEVIDEKGKPAYVCPRQLVKKVLADANEMGFNPVFSQEFEWFNFAETPQSANEKQFKNLTPLTPGMFGYSVLRSSLENPFFTELFEQLKNFNVPLEGLHTETGPPALMKQQLCIPTLLKLQTGQCYLKLL